ncbi:MAG TPA: cytochrome C oxidase subunit IV family protein [Polyangiaceae bacterium]|nr:cytochrome C oxidase subunit IV family protein [Polyangiaceae bacterium]
MADDDKKSIPPVDDEEEVKTSVETIDAKRAEAEREKAESERPAAKADDDSDDNDAGSTDDDDGAGAADDADDGADSDEDDDAEGSADDKEPAEAPVAVAPKTDGAYRESAGHGHEEHHGFAHVTPLKLLFGVLGILLVLTVATVAVTSIDLGSQWNLVVAMVIATIKAGLVVTFFMHLLWDKRFHLLVFLSSVLFLILFLGLAITDHKEYQHDIDAKEADLKAQAQK